jgi:hypothetical protein
MPKRIYIMVFYCVGCLEECSKIVKENQPDTSFTVCKSVLNSKSKDESLVINFAIFFKGIMTLIFNWVFLFI